MVTEQYQKFILCTKKNTMLFCESNFFFFQFFIRHMIIRPKNDHILHRRICAQLKGVPAIRVTGKFLVSPSTLTLWCPELQPVSQATGHWQSWMKLWTSQGPITSLHRGIRTHMKSSPALKNMFKSFIVNIFQTGFK